LKAKLLAWADNTHAGLAKYLREEWLCGDNEQMWSRAFVPRIQEHACFTNNFIEAWHKLLKSKALQNKNNRRLDLLLDTLITTMHQILWRGLYGKDTEKLRKKIGEVVKLAGGHLSSVVTASPFNNRTEGRCMVKFGGKSFEVSLRGLFGDGPHCSCVSSDCCLCVHIIIAILANGYTFSELHEFGFNGAKQDMLYKTFRGTSDEDVSSTVSLVPGRDCKVESPEDVAFTMSAGDRQLYTDAIQYLEQALTSLRQLPNSVRRSVESRVWHRFREGMHGTELIRRDLANERITTITNTSRLPKVRSIGRPKLPAKRAHVVESDTLHSVLAAGLTSGVARLSDGKCKNEVSIGDWQHARFIISRSPAGNISSLTLHQLANVCRGLRLSVSGNKPDLITRIQDYDAAQPPH
jgi:hypothetical protein